MGGTIFRSHLDSQILNTPELDFIGTSHFTCGCQHPSLAKTLGHVLNFGVIGTLLEINFSLFTHTCTIGSCRVI